MKTAALHSYGPVPALAGRLAAALIQSHSARRACRRALGCERVSVSSSVVAAVPATVRRRRASRVVCVARGTPSRARRNAERAPVGSVEQP